MLIYIALLVMIFMVVLKTLLSFSSTYRTIAANRIIEASAITSLERMTRDIRNATSIDAVNSTFGSNPGILSLITTQNGVSTTTKFYVSSNTIQVDVNGTNIGPLTTSRVSVTSLIFTQLTGSTTNAVKIDMTLQGSNGNVTKTKIYHSTIVLKGS